MLVRGLPKWNVLYFVGFGHVHVHVQNRTEQKKRCCNRYPRPGTVHVHVHGAVQKRPHGVAQIPSLDRPNLTTCPSRHFDTPHMPAWQRQVSVHDGCQPVGLSQVHSPQQRRCKTVHCLLFRA